MTDKRESDAYSLTGAYALNALSDDERLAFEVTLGESEAVRHEVTELTDTAVLLGLSVRPVSPSPALKASVMDRIATLPQLPVLAQEPPLFATPATTATPATPVKDTGAASRKAQARWFARPVVMAASVAAALGLIAGGGLLVNTLGSSSTQQVQADGLAAINAAGDSQQVVTKMADGATATLVWSAELESSALIVDGLESLPDNKVYELWYIDAKSVARPAGTFTVGSDGSTWRVLDGQMKQGDTVGVTVEPHGGSKQPTTTPIVAIQSA